MSKEKRRVPKLRFPGFTEDWEQCKFSDLYEKISEKNDLSYSLDKIISVANMYYKSDAKVSNEEYLKTYNIFRYGEIAFEGNKSKDFAYGRFVENTIGDGIISHVFEVFRPIVKYDICFWKYYINYEPIMGKVLSRCTKKTTMMTNLVAKDFLRETVLVPTLAEQNQIGTLLNALDKSITLHQRKLDNLKLKKKALLQKLFPKNGERYPELRFPGFTDAWEQRELDELVDVLDGDRGKNYPKAVDFEVQGHTLFLSASNVTNEGFSFKNNQYITKEKSDSMGNGRLVEDDVIITSRGSLGHVAWYNREIQRLMPHVRINSGMLILRKKVDISMSYLQQFIKSYKGQNQISFISFGSAQPQLTKKDVQKVNIIYPVNLNEQIKIETYFSKLDDLITLHQRKLDHLQLQKKALLQQMFV